MSMMLLFVANSEVAAIPVGFAFFFLNSHRAFFKVLFGCLWLLFLPNTAYLFADLVHFPAQWNSAGGGLRHVILILQFAALEALGIVTFLVAFLPLERIVKPRSREIGIVAILLCNLLVAYGTVLGRWGHVNSWVVFTRPAKVLLAAMQIFRSLHLLELTLLFFVVCNGIYFLFRSTLLRCAKNVL
jgi:uncharacterized membrane protein